MVIKVICKWLKSHPLLNCGGGGNGFFGGQAIDVILVRKLFGGRCEEKGSLVCRAELRGCIQPDRYVQRFNKENEEEEEALLSSTHYGVNGRQKRRRRRMCVCVGCVMVVCVVCAVVSTAYTWNTVTIAHRRESKFLRSHVVDWSLVLRQNLHPNKFMPRMLPRSVNRWKRII